MVVVHGRRMIEAAGRWPAGKGEDERVCESVREKSGLGENVNDMAPC